MIESNVISMIEASLRHKNLYFINVHGSIFSRNGTPDIITLDSKGQFVGIEVKKPNGKVSVNQARRAIDILKSGGRFILGYPDFDIEVFYSEKEMSNTVLFNTKTMDEIDLFEQLNDVNSTTEVLIDEE